MMRAIAISEGEYYHIFNRGMHKQLIFNNDQDRYRFLFLLIHFQSPFIFSDVGEAVKNFKNSLRQHSVLTLNSLSNEIIQKRTVELASFILMPNHFHLIVKEVKTGGIATFMQRLQNSYTKYFNIKNEVNGHLFQGPYRLVHIKNNEQLLYASAYVHRNCRELKGWRDREAEYLWSSYLDYVKQNRWKKLLSNEIVMDQFTSPQEYQKWVESSGAKEDFLEKIEQID